jgi:hypothetical protein
LGLPGSPKGGPGKPVPGYGQGQAYQACPGLDPGSGMTLNLDTLQLAAGGFIDD